MHSCFEEMKMKWRIVLEDLAYFALGRENQVIVEENRNRIYFL